jgi:hypothetical protein
MTLSAGMERYSSHSMDPPRLDSSRDPSIPRGGGGMTVWRCLLMDPFLRDNGLVEDSYSSVVPSTQD